MVPQNGRIQILVRCAVGKRVVNQELARWRTPSTKTLAVFGAQRLRAPLPVYHVELPRVTVLEDAVDSTGDKVRVVVNGPLRSVRHPSPGADELSHEHTELTKLGRFDLAGHVVEQQLDNAVHLCARLSR